MTTSFYTKPRLPLCGAKNKFLQDGDLLKGLIFKEIIHKMRRSAAPSVRAAKKMKFCTPFLAGNKANTAENSENSTTISLVSVHQADPNQVSLLFQLFAICRRWLRK